MENKGIKLPNPNAVKELRERSNRRKEERLENYKEIAEVWKKKTPSKKIAKNSDLPDVEL